MANSLEKEVMMDARADGEEAVRIMSSTYRRRYAVT
jgi:hypothetical protein